MREREIVLDLHRRNHRLRGSAFEYVADASHAERDEQLRHRRAAMEEQMFAIMQSNTRI